MPWVGALGEQGGRGRVHCWPSTMARGWRGCFREAQALSGRKHACHSPAPSEVPPVTLLSHRAPVPLAAVTAAGVGSPTESPLLEPSTPPSEPSSPSHPDRSPEARTLALTCQPPAPVSAYPTAHLLPASAIPLRPPCRPHLVPIRLPARASQSLHPSGPPSP